MKGNRNKRTYLRRLMDAGGYTNEDVARAIGCAIPTACLKVQGKSDFTIREMWKVAKLLRLDTDTMLRAFPASGVSSTTLV